MKRQVITRFTERQQRWINDIALEEYDDNVPEHLLKLMTRHGVEAILPIVQTIWGGARQIGPHTEAWRKVWYWICFTKKRTPRATRLRVMRPADRAVYAALPNRVEIYRGFANQDEEICASGFSWTLNLRIAQRFAENWSRLGKPTVATMQVEKGEILAYFNERPEEEVILDPWSIDMSSVRIEPLLHLERFCKTRSQGIPRTVCL